MAVYLTSVLMRRFSSSPLLFLSLSLRHVLSGLHRPTRSVPCRQALLGHIFLQTDLRLPMGSGAATPFLITGCGLRVEQPLLEAKPSLTSLPPTGVRHSPGGTLGSCFSTNTPRSTPGLLLHLKSLHLGSLRQSDHHKRRPSLGSGVHLHTHAFPAPRSEMVIPTPLDTLSNALNTTW